MLNLSVKISHSCVNQTSLTYKEKKKRNKYFVFTNIIKEQANGSSIILINLELAVYESHFFSRRIRKKLKGQVSLVTVLKHRILGVCVCVCVSCLQKTSHKCNWGRTQAVLCVTVVDRSMVSAVTISTPWSAVIRSVVAFYQRKRTKE